MKKISKNILNVVFNKKIMYLMAVLHGYLKGRFMQAQGAVALNRIRNKGYNCLFHGEVTVLDSDKLILGNNIRVGSGGFFFATGGLSIGDNTQISRNVTIYSGNHNVEGNAIPYDDTYILKSVVIGKSVWIGMNVMITPGVTIGDGAIIGMGTVVSKDIPKGAILVSAEQRIVKYRDVEAFTQKDNDKRHFAVLWPTK